MEPDDLIGQSWAVIRRAAQEYVRQQAPDAYERACEWYTSPQPAVRFAAVLVLGGLASQDARALSFLYARCGHDPAWQVREGLAMAFDTYCADVGYEVALPVIRHWLLAP